MAHDRWLYYESGTVSQCIELLCGSFADNEIEITCGDGGVMHSDFVAQVIDRYIRPFAKDSLRQLFLYGFVAWRTQSVEKGAYRTPVIVDVSSLPGEKKR